MTFNSENIFLVTHQKGIFDCWTYCCLQQSAKDLGITWVAVIVRLGGKGLKKFWVEKQLNLN